LSVRTTQVRPQIYPGDVSERRKIQQAYRFELDPNQAQRVLLTKSVGASRFVYNWGLEQSNGTYVRLGKRPKLGELKKRLVELKKGECPWLYEVSAHIGQSALRDLNDALERYFKGLTGQGRSHVSRALRSAASMTQRACMRSNCSSATSGYPTSDVFV
jgi:Helix-turn-helix domain